MPKGGMFLLEQVSPGSFFVPEMLTSDQRALGSTAREFVEKEVMPLSDRIESGEVGLMPKLLKKAGEIGLLMAEVPEAYGGLGLGKVESTVISENSTMQGSFEVAFMCHTGIGTLPLVYWGTEEQKSKYLPGLARGELLGAYALTEASAGSDAMAGRATARLSSDKKKYILNGEKLYITNGGFADLITVFAKVDGKMTAFLVERGFKGVSVGPEEKKMGIHGSSTVPLVFQDAEVPVENVLGELGRGHKIAFNTLNVGRWKLGSGCVGACKCLISMVSRYVKERVQFGRPLAAFQLIRDKIADCAIRTYLLESLVYRYAGMLDGAHAAAKTQADRTKDLEEYAIEASISKVFGSETLQFVADEAVQMYGGYGFCRDYVVERFYRDCRINRIFEGTNEINRLLISGTLLKRAMAGGLDLMTEMGNILVCLREGFPKKDPWTDACEQLKRLAIYISAIGAQRHAENIQERQTLLAGISDMIIEAFAVDSGLARSAQTEDKVQQEMVRAYIAARLPLMKVLARQLLINIFDGNKDEIDNHEKAIDRIVPNIVYDTTAAKEMIAARFLA